MIFHLIRMDCFPRETLSVFFPRWNKLESSILDPPALDRGGYM